MRVMLVGQSWLGEQTLHALRAAGHAVAAVAAPAGDRLAAAAIAAGLSAHDPGSRLTAEGIPDDVDLLVCAHAHTFVTAAARRRARRGAIGYHPSLLPRHRGRDAIRWAIHMGERITGGSVYQLTDRADAGPILAQRWCFIRPDDTPLSLWQRELGPMGRDLLVRAVAAIAAGQAVACAQDESLATWEPAFERTSLRTGSAHAAP